MRKVIQSIAIGVIAISFSSCDLLDVAAKSINIDNIPGGESTKQLTNGFSHTSRHFLQNTAFFGTFHFFQPYKSFCRHELQKIAYLPRFSPFFRIPGGLRKTKNCMEYSTNFKTCHYFFSFLFFSHLFSLLPIFFSNIKN